MIDEEKTFREKGYRSTDLSHGSHKKVWRICDECGEGRWIEFKAYRDLCKLCTCRTAEFREKQSNAHKNIYDGKNNPFYGKTHTPETIEKLRISHIRENLSDETIRKMSKAREGIKPSEDAIQKMRESGKRENLSDETLLKMSIANSGKNNGNWKGGITSENALVRSSDEYADWRTSVFERDNYTCQECGKRGGIVLNAHHILPFGDWTDKQYSLNIANGITLCKDCHRKTFRKEYELFGKYFDIANGITKQLSW